MSSAMEKNKIVRETDDLMQRNHIEFVMLSPTHLCVAIVWSNEETPEAQRRVLPQMAGPQCSVFRIVTGE